MDFFEFEVFGEFSDLRLVLAHVSASGMFIVEFLLKKYFNSKHQKSTSLCVVRKKRYVNQRKKTKNFAVNHTTQIQWMCGCQQRRDESRLQSAFQILRLTGTKNKHRGSRRGSKLHLWLLIFQKSFLKRALVESDFVFRLRAVKNNNRRVRGRNTSCYKVLNNNERI